MTRWDRRANWSERSRKGLFIWSWVCVHRDERAVAEAHPPLGGGSGEVTNKHTGIPTRICSARGIDGNAVNYRGVGVKRPARPWAPGGLEKY